jgi:hypothetical protein
VERRRGGSRRRRGACGCRVAGPQERKGAKRRGAGAQGRWGAGMQGRSAGLQQRSVEGVAAPRLHLALVRRRSPGRCGPRARGTPPDPGGGGGGGLPRLPLLAPLLPRGREVRCFAVVVGPLGALLGRRVAYVAVAVPAALGLLQAAGYGWKSKKWSERDLALTLALALALTLTRWQRVDRRKEEGEAPGPARTSQRHNSLSRVGSPSARYRRSGRCTGRPRSRLPFAHPCSEQEALPSQVPPRPP